MVMYLLWVCYNLFYENKFHFSQVNHVKGSININNCGSLVSGGPGSTHTLCCTLDIALVEVKIYSIKTVSRLC